MIKKLYLSLVIILLVYATIAFAIPDVDCDTLTDGGKRICQYTGIYRNGYQPFTRITGDDNPTTKEEQDSFGTAGLLTKVDPSGIELSFGGGGMDWYGKSCENTQAPGHCVGVDVQIVELECLYYSGGTLHTESIAFDGDPCPDGFCDWLEFRRDSPPRRITKARCNFKSSTPIGKYAVSYDAVMNYYDSYHGNLKNDWFSVLNWQTLGCTSYKGCASDWTCVAISDDTTACQCIDQTGCQKCGLNKGAGSHCDCNEECASGNCDGGICKEACQCTSGSCCDGCNYKPEGSQPTDKTDGYIGDPFCLGKDIYQTYRDWKCTGSSSTATYEDTNKFKKSCSEICWAGECKLYKMKILFLPVNWRTGESKFNQEAQKHANFFLDHLPTKCGDEVGVDWKFSNCQLTESNFCGGHCSEEKYFIEFDLAPAKELERLKDCADEKNYNYNYIVGLMDHRYNCPNSSGMGYSCKKQAVISEISDVMTSSHELGHEFGLLDEYNRFLANEQNSPNPLSIEYGCDSNPDCEGDLCCCGVDGLPVCTKDPINTCCLGNKHEGGGRSIMSFSDPYGLHSMTPRGFEQSCLNQIKGDNGLKCT